MSLYGCLVLPQDVRIVPMPDLDPAIRARIDASDDDYAISRPRSRSPTSVLDPDSVKLLANFRSPTRIVDAVLEFARQQGRDPRTTLDAAYPVLSRLYRLQLLVPDSSDLVAPIEGDLHLGDVVFGFHLMRCVQVLDDNEVFLGRDADGRYAAVKFYRQANPRVIRRLVREARLLRRLAGRRVPAVLGLARAASGVGLITEWVSAIEVQDAAALLRVPDSARDEHGLLALCIEVACAFAELHEAAVVHGDVHPRNILVDASGAVRLIDLGCARDLRRPHSSAIAGGVPFYRAPECAEALQAGAAAAPTSVSEQYSVAALLYQLWTGFHYLDWSLERSEMLRQIAQDDPVCFEARRVPEWPALERILQRALEKSPESRFPGVKSLAGALAELLPEAQERDRRRDKDRMGALPECDLLERSLGRYAIGGEALRDGLRDAPVASINYGAAGIAYALLRIAQKRSDPRLLAAADLWSESAYALAERDDAFYNADLQIERATVGEVSLFHSIAGPHCVRALVSAAQGDAACANAALIAFAEHTMRACGGDVPSAGIDLVVGRAGLLLGCAELVESLPDFPNFERAPVLARGEQISRDLVSWIKAEPIETSDLHTLGIAHGWSGMLFSVLRWARAIGCDPDPIIVERLRELGTLAQPSGAALRWPTHRTGSSFVDGWCNGSAGFCMLFALACRVLREPEFGALAERAAVSSWSSLTRLGSLCCGQAGIGYALLSMHRLTGESIWLHRARMAARRATTDHSQHFARDALYKGAVGVALLAEDLVEPADSAMPLFEPVY